MLNRRSFLLTGNKVLGALAISNVAPSFARSQATSGVVSIRLKIAPPLANIPDNFVGLGYEMSSAARLGLLSVQNARYVRLIKNLGRKGVLRLGGIVSDFSRYAPQGQIVAEPKHTVVTRASLEQLSAFLKEIGWTAIWSVNFGNGTLEEAVTEARAVASILGKGLYALEIGNEVDRYGHGEHSQRKPPYNYDMYRAEYTVWHNAISNAVPGVRFAAPDATFSAVEWVEEMSKDAHGDVQLLTIHYYRNGQRRGSVEQLAVPDPMLQSKLKRLKATARQSGIPWRMCETNSFSGGGRPGVSDTMLAALWTLDYMLLLAQYGCAGVNIETGVNQLGFVSFYSPIQDDGKGNNTAGVPYYGMLACVTAMDGSPEVLPIDMDLHGMNITAYALGTAGKPRSLVVVNRDASQDAEVVFADLKMGSVHAMRLSAPSEFSRADVTFAGAAVDAGGHWRPRKVESIRNGKVTVPRMSAVVLLHAI